MQHSLTKNISLGYNLGVEFDGTSDDPVFIYTLSTGFNLSEKLYTFIEVYGTLFEDAEHNIDAGFAYAVSKNFKVDISSGFGLSPNAPKYFISLGASVRFKTAK